VSTRWPQKAGILFSGGYHMTFPAETRGNMGDSRGVVKTNLIKALLETRGCRWISYSNSPNLL